MILLHSDCPNVGIIVRQLDRQHHCQQAHHRPLASSPAGSTCQPSHHRLPAQRFNARIIVSLLNVRYERECDVEVREIVIGLLNARIIICRLNVPTLASS
jgi:hypothetical protein